MTIMLLLVGLLWRVHMHYQKAAKQLGRGLDGAEPVAQQFLAASVRRALLTAIIPVDEINRAVLRSVAFARTISPNTTAVHVSMNRDEAQELKERWEESIPDVPFVVVDSPYRSLVQPLIAYFDALTHTLPDELVIVVLPQFVTRWPWERFLHNQLALRLKKALANRPNTIIVDVPFRFEE